SRERIKSAIKNCGLEFPLQNITVNLATADVKKEGSGFDLPISLGILGTTGVLLKSDLKQHLFLGELSLDGGLRPVKGALSIAAMARQKGIRKLVVPAENAREAAVVGDIDVYGVHPLPEVLDLINETREFTRSRVYTQVVLSEASPIGGGVVPRHGVVSLENNGLLFLDELPEFQRNVLEVLRQHLEDGHVTIARASMSLTFPARFMLAAAMNPCPCGYFNDPSRECTCTPPLIQRYVSKISGPLLDRIDIHIDM